VIRQPVVAATIALVTNLGDDSLTSYDFIVVGGGTAGSVLAARLSETRDPRVLLLEAGPADGPKTMSIPGAWPTLIGSEVDWGYNTVPQPGLAGATIPYPRGRVLGGSSAINAMIHVRGHRSAIDAWATAGATGWGYDDLLPYFRRSEHTEGLDMHYRGVGGPMRPQRVAPLKPAARAALEAFQELRYAVSADLNAAEAEGAVWNEVTIVGGVRQSAADAYLRPALDRTNLTVISGAPVHKLVISGGRCTGVEYTHGGKVQRAETHGDVLLCAGAIGSPQVLMLSGVGPADALRAHDLKPVVDLAGVGENLSDHPLGFVVYSAARPLPQAGSGTVDVVAALRTDPELTAPNIHILFDDIPLAPRAMHGQSGFTIGFALLAPRGRGSVRLVSADPGIAPAIDPGFLDDERDVADMLGGFRVARAVGNSRAMASWRKEEVFPGSAVHDGDQLRRSGSVGTYFHPVGTCKMGTDAAAVVDQRLRVYGVDGLRVVDASVMPSLPAGNTNATVLAIAERAAAIVMGQEHTPDERHEARAAAADRDGRPAELIPTRQHVR
jgi:choline dehydrogenase